MKNLELKCRYPDLLSAKRLAGKIGAKYIGVLKQTDTYSKINSGRLKLRNINNREFELIYYDRPDKKTAGFCKYERISLSKADYKKILNLLKKSKTISGVIKKARTLYLFKKTRIHLDKVAGLGKFLEFEIICKLPKDENQAPAKMKMLKEVFRIPNKNLISVSYIDLLKKR